MRIDLGAFPGFFRVLTIGQWVHLMTNKGLGGVFSILFWHSSLTFLVVVAMRP